MRRTRFRLAGATLLTTLFFSFAESAWASTCDPWMSEMGASEMAAMPGMDDMPDSEHSTPLQRPAEQGDAGSQTDCPFTPAGGLGCAASASLPAMETVFTGPAHVHAFPPTAASLGSYVLRAHAIFHPPKP
jgi:hypothetical protein